MLTNNIQDINIYEPLITNVKINDTILPKIINSMYIFVLVIVFLFLLGLAYYYVFINILG